MKGIRVSEVRKQPADSLSRHGGENRNSVKLGESVAKNIPIEGSDVALIGSMKGRLRIEGDLLSTGLQWEATISQSCEKGVEQAPR